MSDTLRVLIVDDEPAARRRLAALLEELDVEVVGEAVSGLDALEQVRNARPDVLLLDISMPELDGFEVARHLPEPKSLVIFQTAHDAYALEAFEHEAVDYVVKPVTSPRLAQALDRARRRLTAGTASALTRDLLTRLQATLGESRTVRPWRVLVRSGAGHRLLPLRDVVKFDVEDGLVYVHSTAGKFLTDYALNELEERARGRFIRTSRRELVNIDRIAKVASNGDGSVTLTLSGGAAARVSRRRAADVWRALDES